MKAAPAVALSVLAGVLTAIAQQDFDVWPAAWVALVPLLLAVRGQRRGRAFAYGWLAWFVSSLITIYWIQTTISNFTRISEPLAIGVLVLLCAASAVFIGVFAVVVEWLATGGVARAVSAPLLWLTFEWLRTFFPAAFPWGFLGYTQHSALPVVQIADVTGVYGVSALIVLVNASLAEAFAGGVRRHARLLVASAAAVALVVAYGFVRLGMLASVEPSAWLTVGIAQGNIAQEEKWDPGNQEATLAHYLQLSARAAAGGAELVVWPEAAVPFFLAQDARQARLQSFADTTGVFLLVGAPGYERRADGVARQYNQAWLVAPRQAARGPYDKIQLVPFGEYVPFGPLLAWVDKAVEAVGDFGRGTAPIVFDGPAAEIDGRLRPVGLGPLICYESIFPDLTRRFSATGADVLVNISNDAWYGRTSAPHQLLTMTAMRAIETRRPVVRATNTGISAVIAATGRIRNRSALFEPAVFVHGVALREIDSIYLRLGDLFVYASALALVALVVRRVRG